MSGEIIAYKVIMLGKKEEEYYDIESLKEALQKYPVISVRVYKGDRPVLMCNMAPFNEEHAKWVLDQIAKALGASEDTEEMPEEGGER